MDPSMVQAWQPCQNALYSAPEWIQRISARSIDSLQKSDGSQPRRDSRSQSTPSPSPSRSTVPRVTSWSPSWSSSSTGAAGLWRTKSKPSRPLRPVSGAPSNMAHADFSCCIICDSSVSREDDAPPKVDLCISCAVELSLLANEPLKTTSDVFTYFDSFIGSNQSRAQAAFQLKSLGYKPCAYGSEADDYFAQFFNLK